MDKKTIQTGDILFFKLPNPISGIDNTYIGQMLHSTSDSKSNFLLSGSCWFSIDNNIEKVKEDFKLKKGKLLYIYRPSSNMELGEFIRIRELLRIGINSTDSLDFFLKKEKSKSSDLIYSLNEDKKEITIPEIEEILGYSIKIVG